MKHYFIMFIFLVNILGIVISEVDGDQLFDIVIFSIARTFAWIEKVFKENELAFGGCNWFFFVSIIHCFDWCWHGKACSEIKSEPFFFQSAKHVLKNRLKWQRNTISVVKTHIVITHIKATLCCFTIKRFDLIRSHLHYVTMQLFLK